MIIYIKPTKLDGEITAAGLYAEYLNGASLIGNRIKVNGGKDIVKYLLSFNAKGTMFDLTEKEDYLPMLSFCACYACSDTQITSNDKDLVKETVTAIKDMGGYAEVTDYGLIVHGKDGIRGGKVTVNDSRVALAVVIASTCADEKSEICGVESIKEIAPTFIEDFISLGGQIKTI